MLSKSRVNSSLPILVFDKEKTLSSCPHKLCHSYEDFLNLHEQAQHIFWVGESSLLLKFSKIKSKNNPWSFISPSSCSISQILFLKNSFGFETVLEAPLAPYEWTDSAKDKPTLTLLQIDLLRDLELGVNTLSNHYSNITLEVFFEVFNKFKLASSLKHIKGVENLCKQVTFVLKNSYQTVIPSGTKLWFLQYLHFFYRQLKLLFQGHEVPSIKLDPGILCLSESSELLFQHTHQSLYLCKTNSQLDILFEKNIFPSFIYSSWRKEDQDLLSYIKKVKYHYYRHSPLLIANKERIEPIDKPSSSYLVIDSIVSERYCLVYYDEMFSLKNAKREQALFLSSNKEVEYYLTEYCRKLFVDLHVLKAPFDHLDTFRKVNPDVILLDVDLEQESEFQILKVIRSDIRFRNTPILLITHAQTKDSLVELAYQAGATEILFQPIQERSFQYRLCKLLQKERQLKIAKHEDAISGLLNREGFKHAFHELTEKKGAYGVLAVLDLDYLKKINDTLGHSTGDTLLLNFAKLLKLELKQNILIARWGGDEFFLFFKDHTQLEVVEKLQTCLQQWKKNQSFSTPLGFSSGLASYPKDGATLEELFTLADNYLYKAKREGRGQIKGHFSETVHY